MAGATSELFPLLFLHLLLSTICEEVQKKILGIDGNSLDNFITEPHKPHSLQNNGDLFESKLEKWIPPFNNYSERKNDQDQVSSPDEFRGYQYLPPPPILPNNYDRECSPCNLEHWVPIVGHHKDNYSPYNKFSTSEHDFNSNLLNGLNNDYSGLYGLPPKIEYGVPQPQYESPKLEYSQLKPNYELSKYNLLKPMHGLLKQKYGPSKEIFQSLNPLYEANIPSSGNTVLLDYMIPPPIHYKLPVLLFHPPKKKIELLPSSLYGTPQKPLYSPKPLYEPPVNSLYGPPPNSMYGSPSKQLYTPPLKPLFGPSSNTFYEITNHNAPNIKYGMASQQFVLPKPKYGPPKPEYGPPKPEYGPSKSEYGPPKPEYGPPKPVYGPPSNQEPSLNPTFSLSVHPLPNNDIPIKSIYEPPKSDLTPLSQNFNPNIFQTIPDSSSDFNNLQDPISQGFNPPPLSLVGNFPSFGDNSLQLTNNFSSHLSNIPLETGFILPPTPSDSYGNPITDENFSFSTHLDSLSASSGDNDHVPANNLNKQSNHIFQLNLQNKQSDQHYLPNLSPFPALPVYEFRNFKEQHDIQQNVQVQQSVKVADYIASVEHPINIVQSPLIDLQYTDESNQNYQNNVNNNVNIISQYSNKDAFPNKIKNFKLSEHPIVVEDTHTATSNRRINITSTDHFNSPIDTFLKSNKNTVIDETSKLDKALHENSLIKKPRNILKDTEINSKSTTPVNQISIYKSNDWILKSYPETISSSMNPPPLNSKSTWLLESTQKPIQIIVPYINTMTEPNLKNVTNEYRTLLPVFIPPMPNNKSDWFKYLTNIETTRLNKVVENPLMSTDLLNKDLMANNGKGYLNRKPLPFDIISLRKNIDDWTHQSFSITKNQHFPVVPPKQIPKGFFTKKLAPEITTNSKDIFDHQLAESSIKETSIHADIKTNVIVAAEADSMEDNTSELPLTLSTAKINSKQDNNSSWKSAYVTVSPYTKEKIYVVTPQAYSFVTSNPVKAWSISPSIENDLSNNTLHNSQKVVIRINSKNQESRGQMGNLKSAPKIVYSEWPHLINNLQTTSSKPTSSHPLFGLMGISAYTPPPNSTVKTIVGHSKVFTVTTPSTSKLHQKT